MQKKKPLNLSYNFLQIVFSKTLVYNQFSQFLKWYLEFDLNFITLKIKYKNNSTTERIIN